MFSGFDGVSCIKYKCIEFTSTSGRPRCGSAGG